MKFLLTICLFSITQLAFSQQASKGKQYSFGNYRVETCIKKSGTQVKVFKDGHNVYTALHQDIWAFLGIDTMNVNNDSLVDFIYCEQEEEYAVVGLLLSDKKSIYRNIDLIYVSPPDNNKTKSIREYILKDIDGDGRKDIVTNVAINNKQYKALNGYSDTLTYKHLQQLLKQKTITPISRAVLIDE